MGPSFEHRLQRVQVQAEAIVDRRGGQIRLSSLELLTSSPGVVAHELAHASASLGGLFLDVPIAAATGYCLDWRLGTLQGAPRDILEAKLQQMRFTPSPRSSALSEIDALMAQYSDGLHPESERSAKDAAVLAALVVGLLDDPSKRPRFLGHLGRGSPARLALEALDDPAVDRWLSSVIEFDPYEATESTLDLGTRLTDTDFEAFRRMLTLKGARLQNPAVPRDMWQAILVLRRRIKERDFVSILEPGARVRHFYRGEDELAGRIRRWRSGRGPVIRVNVRPIGGRSPQAQPWTISPALIEYIRRSPGELVRLSGGALHPTVEVGTFGRNKLEEGLVTVQWSDMIATEAETVTVSENYYIVSALITLHLNLNYPPVVLQQLGVALSGVNLVDAKGYDGLFANPLRRPREYLQHPAFVRWRQLGDGRHPLNP